MRFVFQLCFIIRSDVSSRFHYEAGVVHFLNWNGMGPESIVPPSANAGHGEPKMNTITPIDAATATPHAIIDSARELGPIFAQRAKEAADEDRFVADNFALL